MIVADSAFYKTFELLEKRLARIEGMLVGGADKLTTLDKIIDCKANAARMRWKRDPELAKMGILVGKRMLFERDKVLAYLRAKAAK